MTTPQTDLTALAREIGTVRDVAARRYVDGNDHAAREHHQMLARLDDWRARILAALAGAETPQGMAQLRHAWEAGFRLCRSYGDNHHHFDGEQKERRWAGYLASVDAFWTVPPPAVDPPALVALVRELQATYPLVGRTRTDSGLERYEAALADVLAWTSDAAAPETSAPVAPAPLVAETPPCPSCVSEFGKADPNCRHCLGSGRCPSASPVVAPAPVVQPYVPEWLNDYVERGVWPAGHSVNDVVSAVYVFYQRLVAWRDALSPRETPDGGGR